MSLNRSHPHRPTPRGLGRFLLAMVTVVSLLAATSCSSDDKDDSKASSGSSTTQASSGSTEAEGSGELPKLTEVEQEFADAVEESMKDTTFFSGNGECLATRWVHTIGEDRIKESGITAEDFAQDGPGKLKLDRATAEKMVDAMETCGVSMEELYEGFAADPISGESDPEQLACMKENAPVSEFREAMILSFTGDEDEALIAIGKKWEACAPTE